MPVPLTITTESANAFGRDFLPGYLGLHFTEVTRGRAAAELSIKKHHIAPNGFLHAATVIALADTTAGYGCVASLPEGASGFTTVNLNCNFLGTAREGSIRTLATLRHGGRTIQHWDSEVFDPTGKLMATFRCTQMILWPR